MVEKIWKKCDSLLHSFVTSYFKFEKKTDSKIYIFFYDFPETALTRILHLKRKSFHWHLVGKYERNVKS